MKTTLKFAVLGLGCIMATSFSSCSDKDDDAPDYKEPDEKYATVTVDFNNAPENLFGSTTYGPNLYYGDQDQVTSGYMVQLYEDTYAQFSINFGETFDLNDPYGYTFFAGGMALSKYHDLENGSYTNQLSAYTPSTPSGNFVVSFGSASSATQQPLPDPNVNTLKDYASCGRVYITDPKGYSAPNPGTSSTVVTGEEEEAFFESVEIANTTYDYLTMLNGNGYTENSDLQSQNGWFKVQFIAFNDNKPTSKPVGYVEAYLANFDSSLEKEAGFSGKIIDSWTKVDLSSLPEACILVVNFVGSDNGDYGLNTPSYCALDNFVISVEKD